MVDLLTPRTDPFWQSRKRRVWAGIGFLCAAFLNPLGGSIMEYARYSSMPSMFAPLFRFLGGCATVGTALGCFAVPVLIGLSITSLVNIKWRSQIRYVPALLVVYVAGIFTGGIGGPSILNSPAIGNSEPIFRALVQYRLDNGRYPDSVDSLVPRYLPTVPQPNTCEPMQYVYGRDKDGTATISLIDPSTSFEGRASATFPPGFRELPPHWRSFWELRYSSNWLD